jgi:hypothetical protein
MSPRVIVCKTCGRTKRGYAKGCWGCGNEGSTVERDRPWRRDVHNHGTEDGPGIACPERRVKGRLVGECIATISSEVLP